MLSDRVFRIARVAMNAHAGFGAGRAAGADGPSTLILRFGQRDQPLLREFSGFGLGAICQTIGAVEASYRHLVYLARTFGLEVFVDPQTHENQLAVAKRSTSFCKLDYSFNRQWDPERARLDPDARSSYVDAVLQAQRMRLASRLLTPYHFVGGRRSRGRALDLQLLESAIERFDAASLATAPEFDPKPSARRLYAAIALWTPTLRDPKERNWLHEKYAEAPVDGYWVKISGLCERSTPRDALACAEFLCRLRAETGKEVVLVGPGNLYQAFLLSEISVCIGIAEGEKTSFSIDRPVGARSLAVFHPYLRRNLVERSPHDHVERAFARAFHIFACSCRFHRPNAPPSGRERKRHAYALRVRDALAIAASDFATGRDTILNELRMGNQAARSLELPPLDVQVWIAVLDVGEKYLFARDEESKDNE